MEGVSELEIYIECISISVMTLSTIGFGRMSPETPKEKVALMIYSMIAGILMCYNIKIIGNLIERNLESGKLIDE